MLSTDPLDLALGPNGDLLVDADGPHTISGIAGVAQLIRIAIMVDTEEWFLNLDFGMPWIEQIFGAKYDEQLVRQKLSTAIANVPGVAEVLSLGLAFDGPSRTIDITWTVRVAFDDTVDTTISGVASVTGGNGG